MICGALASRMGRRSAAILALAAWSAVACQAGPRPSPSATVAVPVATPPKSSPSPSPASISGHIAYVHNSGELGGVPVTDIWIVDANGGQPTSLTTSPENEFTPIWLLDGSRLVFAIFDFRTEAGPYHGRLVSVMPDGIGQKDLGPVAEWSDAVMSPDGRYVAFGGGGTDGITLLDRSTGEAKVLTKDGATDPIWSPDGRALLIREPVLESVAIVGVPSGHLTRFTKPNIESVVGWTADGDSAVFSETQSLNTPTWLAPIAGGPIVAMPPDTELASPKWMSPDGRLTLGRGSKGNAFDAWSATGASIALAPELRMLAGFPSWASNGGAIAFAGSTSDEVGDRRSEIYVVGLAGQAPARITPGPLDTSPAWEPST
jgi:Tol biopolymer transport system component